jgi:hypothetical protein
VIIFKTNEINHLNRSVGKWIDIGGGGETKSKWEVSRRQAQLQSWAILARAIMLAWARVQVQAKTGSARALAWARAKVGPAQVQVERLKLTAVKAAMVMGILAVMARTYRRGEGKI